VWLFDKRNFPAASHVSKHTPATCNSPSAYPHPSHSTRRSPSFAGGFQDSFLLSYNDYCDAGGAVVVFLNKLFLLKH
jgi:hypothetical protein